MGGGEVTISIDSELYEKLEKAKGSLTWSEFIAQLLAKASANEATKQHQENTIKRIESRARVFVLLRRMSPWDRRIKYSAARQWIKSYVGYQAFTAMAHKDYDKLTVWAALVGDKLVVMNYEPSILSRSMEVELEILNAVLDKFRKLCRELGCNEITVDPRIPLPREVIELIKSKDNSGKDCSFV